MGSPKGCNEPVSPSTLQRGSCGIVKVKGTLIGPTHCDVQGVPNCTATTVPCFLPAYGYLGYPTAWMMFQLQGESLAHGAFVSGTGEMFSETKNWQLVASSVP